MISLHMISTKKAKILVVTGFLIRSASPN